MPSTVFPKRGESPFLTKLEQVRSGVGLTQSRLAEQAGVHRATILSLERDLARGCRVLTAQSLAQSLSMSVGDLFDGSPEEDAVES